MRVEEEGATVGKNEVVKCHANRFGQSRGGGEYLGLFSELKRLISYLGGGAIRKSSIPACQRILRKPVGWATEPESLQLSLGASPRHLTT